MRIDRSSSDIVTLIDKEAKRRCKESQFSLDFLACQDRRFRHDDRRPFWEAMFVPQIKSEIERLEKAGLTVGVAQSMGEPK